MIICAYDGQIHQDFEHLVRLVGHSRTGELPVSIVTHDLVSHSKTKTLCSKKDQTCTYECPRKHRHSYMHTRMFTYLHAHIHKMHYLYTHRTHKHTHVIQHCVVEMVKLLSLDALFVALFKLSPLIMTGSYAVMQ